MDSLFINYKFSENVLLAPDGTSTPSRYNSPFHQNIAYQLQDPPLAEKIAKAFETTIGPLLNDVEKPLFEEALTSTIMVFSKKALSKALKENRLSKWIESAPYQTFLKETLPPVRAPLQGRFKVCVLTTTAAGGNYSVTRAVQGWLEKSLNAEVQVIDVEEFAEIYDTMKQATGKYTYDSLYKVFFQQIGLGSDFLTDREEVNKKLAKFFPSRTLGELKNKVEAFSPNLLISTRNYKADDFSVGSSLNIPLRMLYCDYDLNFSHAPLIGNTDPHMVQYWFPSLSAEGFSPLLPNTDGNEPWETTLQKIAEITHSPLEEIRQSFREVGFPVGPEFSPIEDTEKLDTLRKKWHLPPHLFGVMVTMGKNGAAALETLFKELTPYHLQKVKIYFICGTNEELFHRLNLSKNEHFEILGFLSHQEMGELMAISTLMVSKPGGSTVGECQAMGLPLLSMHAHELWEKGNERQLDKVGLLCRRNINFPLGQQIEEFVTAWKKRAPLEKWSQKFSSAFF